MSDFSKVRGRIFDIQRFSVHDGPGIRTIVFLKGCMFRCRWCCNPEGQEYAPVTLYEKDGKQKLAGEDVTAGEVMQTVTKDMYYYQRSGGGLTLSGGEMLLQPDFALALLTLAHRMGITTAVETTGYADKETLSRLLPEIDYVLLDIKHMDPQKHLEFIGKDNKRVLENAAFIAKHAKHTVIRVPTIPTFNDTDEEIRAISRFAASLDGVEALHLLPYHRLGSDKYAATGRTYPMGDIPLISGEKMRRLLACAQESGLPCQIGG